MGFDVNDLMRRMNGNTGSFDKENNYNNKKWQKDRNNSGNNKDHFAKKGFNGEKKEDKDSYVGAPYNFVPFYKNPVKVDEAQMAVHDRLQDDLLSGEIDYVLKAETPVFVDDGSKKHEFVKNSRGEYAIPGSTIRGLIRNNAQILGFSNFGDDIDDDLLMFRHIAKGAERNYYRDVLGAGSITIGKNTVSILKNVSAGYITKEGNEYVIYKTKVDKIGDDYEQMNYYIVSEREVVNNHLERKGDYSFYEKHPEYMMNKIDEKFEKKETTDRKGKVTVQYFQKSGNGNINYKPGINAVSFRAEGRRIKKLAEPGMPGMEQGFLVRTGKMKNKKAAYVVPEIDRSKEALRIKADGRDAKAFLADYKKRENTLKQQKNMDFFRLPTEGEDPKPIFYIHLGERLYFGFTPYLRLFYDNTIKNGFHQTDAIYDYAKSLFGCGAGEKRNGFKSKTSFTDAVVSKDCKIAKSVSLILGEPKSTSYLDYVLQDDAKKIKTYHCDNFELRGVKQYWLHKDIVKVPDEGNNNDVKTQVNAMEKGAEFRGKIRFDNLTKAELGLLLWSIRLEEGSWMNVGKAKAFGYGAVSVAKLELNLMDYARAYSFETLDLTPYKKGDINDHIETYKQEMKEKLKKAGRPVDDLTKMKEISEFFIMKRSASIPANETTRYMTLKEYGDRDKTSHPALKKPSEIAEIKRGNK